MVIKVYILRQRMESIRMGKNKGKIWGGNQLKKKLLCHTLMVWFKKSGQNTHIPTGPRENVLRTHASWPEGFVWSFMWLFIVGIFIVFNITLSFNLFLKSFLLSFLNRLKFLFKNYYLFIYLFIELWWVFVSVRGLSLVAASGGQSSLRCAGLSLSWPLLLRSTGSRRAGSAVVAHGPSCSTACGIFPDQGLNLCPLH